MLLPQSGVSLQARGYLVLLLTAVLTFWTLLHFGDVTADKFLEIEAVKSLRDPKLRDYILSFVAAAASIIMYLAYRRNVIAGPLIALILIPATAAVGMSLALGEWVPVGDIAARLGLDMALVVGTGLVLIYLKQKLVHKRAPLR